MLITGSVAISAALLIIQANFIYNTYLLHQKQTLSEIRNELVKLEKKVNVDSMRYAWMGELKEIILEKSKPAIREYVAGVYNSVISQKINQHIKKSELLDGYKVNYFTNISSAIIVFENDNHNSISVHDKLWYGNNAFNSELNLLNTYTLSSGIINSPHGVVSCELNTESGFGVNNWRKGLYLKLLWLLIFSASLILSVIFMFYVSIKNIIRQKKIADVKTDFVNNITHEFNTPLAALNIAIATIKSIKEKMNDQLLQNAVSTIERQYQRLKDLVNQATQYSLGEKEIKLNSVTVSNQQFLINAVSDFKNAHPEIEISFTPTNSDVKILIDQFHFTTIINNLLDNAVNYGNGVIEVKSFLDSRDYKITIADNGSGIPKSKQQLIFNKFTRLESGNIHNNKGLGLGLYYAKQIINAHHGTITLVSEPGMTTFTILIPQA